MNKYSHALLTLKLLLMTPMFLGAQAPPSDPGVAVLSGDQKWVVDVTPLSSSKKAPVPTPAQDGGQTEMPPQGARVLNRIENVRTDRMRYRANVYADNTKTEKWWLKQYCVLREPHSDAFFIFPWASFFATEEGVEDFGNLDFPELRWLDRSKFIEWTKVGDRPVALYGRKVSETQTMSREREREFFQEGGSETNRSEPMDDTMPPSTSRPEFDRLAWIDAESKRPLVVEMQSTRRTYRFDSTPVGEIQWPAGMREAVGRYIEAAAAQDLNVKP